MCFTYLLAWRLFHERAEIGTFKLTTSLVQAQIPPKDAHRVNQIAHTDLNSFLNTFTDGTFRRNSNANRGSFSRHKPSYGMY